MNAIADIEIRNRLQLKRTELLAYLSDQFHHRQLNEAREKVLNHLLDCISRQTCLTCPDPKNECLLYPCLELKDPESVICWFSSSD